MVGLVTPRHTKGPPDMLDLNHRATSRLYSRFKNGQKGEKSRSKFELGDMAKLAN